MFCSYFRLPFIEDNPSLFEKKTFNITQNVQIYLNILYTLLYAFYIFTAENNIGT